MKIADMLVYSFIFQYVIALILYLRAGDYPRTLYWLSAALISISTLTMR
jgi:hypothetical protein